MLFGIDFPGFSELCHLIIDGIIECNPSGSWTVLVPVSAFALCLGREILRETTPTFLVNNIDGRNGRSMYRKRRTTVKRMIGKW